ncbi:MAG: DoxX family protein [Pseudoclavibacter sp.]
MSRSQTDVINRSAGSRYVLALLRLVVGFIFLWAFLDKLFGLGYSTKPAMAWINGGKPAQGFLLHLEGGPFKDFFASLASPLVDWLFMLGMLGVGLAVMLGIGLRLSAIAGTLIMALMYFAELPGGYPDSTNPVVDYHVVYALALILFAFTYAGDTLGFGRPWRGWSLVKAAPWLI